MTPSGYTGLTWDHPRGFDALSFAAQEWFKEHNILLTWKKQPLEGFESHPIHDLLMQYDLVVLDHPHLGDAIDSGYLLPLESIFSSTEIALWTKQSIGSAMESYRLKNNSYALPLDVAAQVMASDPTQLLNIPDSWDDILVAASKLPVALSLAGPHALSNFYSLCLSLGAEPGQTDFISQKEAWEALRILASLYKTRPIGSETANPIELLEAMSGEGSISLIPLIFGYVNYSHVQKKRPVRYSEAPRFGSGRRGSVLGGTGIGLSTRTNFSPALIDHLRWLMSEEAQVGFIPLHNGQPSSRDAWTNEKINQSWGNFYQGTIETVQNAWIRPRFKNYVAFHNAASQRLRAWLNEESDPNQFIETLKEMWRNAKSKIDHSGERGFTK